MDGTGMISLEYSDGDVDTNRSVNPDLHGLIAERYSRRQTLFGGLGAALSMTLVGCGGDEDDAGTVTTTPTVVSFGGQGQSSAGKVVSLAGTSANGAVQNPRITQLSGPPVNLSGANSMNATFIAPAVAVTTPLVFRFTGTDATGREIFSDTTVAVDPARLDFAAVPKNLTDRVTVPAGYSVTVLYRLGDPLNAATPAYANNGSDTNFAARAGDHNDALYYYGLTANGNGRDDNNSRRGLLVMNHENITQTYLHANGPTNNVRGGMRPEAEALKEMEAHGLSIVEVMRDGNMGAWTYVQSSALNRRITPLTPMVLSGPVRGSALVRTQFSPGGTDTRGTINNCANGYTPWGTNLTCEENYAGYFRRPTAVDNPKRPAKEVRSLTRNGVGSTDGNYFWASVQAADANSTIFRRWDAQVRGASAIEDFRNEPNQFGWVVETDPYDPSAAPRKRTALGRFAHEGAWPGNFVAGVRPAFYMGDDSRGEYVYKFVSATPWVAADGQSANRLAIGDKYLDAGTLYVARFAADGSGTWVPLVFGQGNITSAYADYAFADQADVLVNARLAGDAAGATRMDRPEWTAVNPATGEMYLTLTNNSQRTAATTDTANPRAYVDPKVAPAGSIDPVSPPSQPTRGNANGHILRLREAGDTTEATSFRWDIYLFGAGSDLDATNINLSGLTADNDLSSPDGMWFARPTNASGNIKPVLWIQTDDGAFTDVTNCMMLAAMPGTTGDGGQRTLTNNDGTTTRTQATIIGATPTAATLRRFLVGPVDCEITGVDSTPDGRTLFVNIQHPGEDGTLTRLTSNWPASQSAASPGSRPRSATIVITKDDGGVVGL